MVLIAGLAWLAAAWPAAALDTALALRLVPGADAVGESQGEPPATPLYRAGVLAGYVFLTRQVVASTGYSGKPIEIAVGLDTGARIVGVEILEQHEPILAIGVDPADLTAFAEAHLGRDVSRPILVHRGEARGPNEVAAVSGATVSSVVIGNAILSAARAVARSRGLLGGGTGDLTDTYVPANWQRLLEDGVLRRLDLRVGAVAAALARAGSALGPAGEPLDPAASFIDLYAGLASPTGLGRALLGGRIYDRVMAGRAAGDQLIVVAANGRYSFKGTAYVRQGTFERIQLVQGERTFVFGRDEHVRLERLALDGAPEFRELALFVLPGSRGFVATEPWRLELLVSGTDGRTATSFSLAYQVPETLRPSAAIENTTELALPWRQVWRERWPDVAVLSLALALLTLVLVFQDALTRRRRLYRRLRIGFLLFTLVWLGWYAGAQLSVMNVLTFADAVRTEFRWDVFLIEPLLFVLWSYVAVAMLFLGRGVYCGWLCPFGALQELLARFARWARLPRFSLPFALHERLWPVKYVIFLGLFALSLGGIGYLVEAIEVEPFKTAIVLRFARAWPFLLYVAVLLGLGLLVERFFCRYLCPLGAALAIPARLRMFEWLKRRWQCGRQCGICAVECPVQAIHPEGQINPNECVHCLECQAVYHDETVCPPLVQRRKRLDALGASAAAVDRALAARRGEAGDEP